MQNYSKVIINYPKYADAYAGRGWAFLQQDRYDDALVDCNQALQLKTNLAEALVCRGEAHSFKGDLSVGLQDCEKAIELRPNYAEAYQCRGFIYTYQNQFDKAIRDYDSSIELEPDLTSAYLGRAIAYSESGNHAMGIKDREKAMQLDAAVLDVITRGHALAFGNRGAQAVSRGDYGDAVADFSKALDLQRDFMPALEGRGKAYMSLRKFDLAVADFTSALSLSPNQAHSYINRGDAYAEIHNYEQAINDFTEATKLPGGSPDAYFKRAEVYDAIHKYEEAKSDYSAVIDTNGDLDAYFVRGNAYLALGDSLRQSGKLVEAFSRYNDAVTDFWHVASARSDDALSMFRCGTANARRNNYDEAIKDYAEAINRDQNLKSQKDIDYSHAFYQRGCRSRSRFDNSINSDDCRKNYESALSDFQKAMDLHPTKNRDAEREIQYLEEMLSERCSEPAVSSNGSGKASLAFAD